MAYLRGCMFYLGVLLLSVVFWAAIIAILYVLGWALIWM